MGGNSGGGGGGTTVQKTEPWDQAKPFYEQGYGYTKDIFTRPKAGDPTQREINPDGIPAYYPNSTVVPFSNETEAALQLTAGRAIGGNQAQNAANQELSRTLSGQYLNGGNPYLQGAINSASDGVVRNYKNAVNPSLMSNFSKAGRFGSNSQATAQSDSQQNLLKQLGDISGNMAYQNYGDERTNQQRAVFATPEMAAADYNDLEKLAAVGQTREDLSSAYLQDDINRYSYDSSRQNAALEQYMNLIQGLNAGGTSTSTSPVKRSNSLLNGLGTAATIASLFTGSDIRIKENIVPVGMEKGHKLYEYNYKGGDQRYIGVMAQEVKVTNPDAVIETPEGYKVNYNKLGIDFRAVN